jgi:hypothetical protein
MDLALGHFIHPPKALHRPWATRNRNRRRRNHLNGTKCLIADLPAVTGSLPQAESAFLPVMAEQARAVARKARACSQGVAYMEFSVVPLGPILRIPRLHSSSWAWIECSSSQPPLAHDGPRGRLHPAANE